MECNRKRLNPMRWIPIVVATAFGWALAGCSDAPQRTAAPAPAAEGAAPALATAAPAAPPAPAVPPILQVPIMPFDEAVLKAANDLFSKAQILTPPDRHALVIDPLVDGITGVQSKATQTMGLRIGDLVQSSYPQFSLQPFSTSSVAKAPVLLVGTFTAINNKAQVTGERDAYRICLALADLRSGKIVAKAIARAQIEGTDTTPLPYFAESPVLAPDKVTEGYVKTCQATRVGDSIDPIYWDNIVASALLNDAITAYDNRRFEDALDIYKGVARTNAGDQLRVYNGIYLSSVKLGRRDEATQAFGRIVDYGLANNRLSVKFLFNPGSTTFVPDPAVSGPYRVWLKEIATRASKSQSCMEIIGHTSRSGPEPINERLSVLRAAYIKQRLDTDAPQLKTRTKAIGRGSQETLMGTGTDDARDAVDRRVEFKVIGC
jgi:outer membrane protein OmpA-like peptidoglycan-associated protein